MTISIFFTTHIQDPSPKRSQPQALEPKKSEWSIHA
jgi:hypothetical protein